MLVVCNIQEDMKYRVSMCEMKMLDIAHEVYITFGLHKMRGISWLAENRLDSQEGLCSID